MKKMNDKYTVECIYHNANQITVGKTLNVIHFNDCYNIEGGSTNGQQGGAARFISLVEDLLEQKKPTLVFFSGDAISPSSSKLRLA